MIKKILQSNITTLVASVLAIGLIGYGGVHAVQAAPRIESADYRAQVQLSNINTCIVENDKLVVGEDSLLQNWPANGETFAIGKTYAEELAVRNANDGVDDSEGEGIDEYVRVSVYRYWTDAEGKEIKNTSLKPSYIDLHFVEDDGWTIDEASSTPERTVLYYNKILKPDETTTPFADKLTIKSDVTTAVSSGTYSYEGAYFHIKVVADAVQTHNGEQAMTSAWGLSYPVEGVE